jgi:hypothetical protein
VSRFCVEYSSKEENMTFRISTPIFCMVYSFSLWAGAQTTSRNSNKSWVYALQSNSIQFASKGSDFAAATPGRFPAWVFYLWNHFLSWEPEDLAPLPTGACDLFNLRESIRRASDVKMRSYIFEQYQAHCKEPFTVGPSNTLRQALQIFTMSYNIEANPFLHRVVFHLPDGQKLKGVLALKDTKSRPLIIVRAGITGNVEDAFAERFFFYQFFERGLFNVLLVENMTGSDYIHFNKSFNFGGLAESYQNIWLAETLRSPSQPISHLVQSVHLVGLSLGGQGVLTAAWLARYQKNPKLFNSFMAFCPLVNTVDTFNYLFKKSWVKYPLEFWARSQFTEFKDFRPDLFNGFMGLPGRLLKAVANSYKRPDAEILGVREPWFIQKQNNYYSLHQLSKWDQTLRDPVWIWITQQDSVVPTRLNTDRLQLVAPVRIEQGNHCSFPVVWDNRVLSALFTGQVLGTSNFQITEKHIILNADPRRKWELRDVKFFEDRQQLEVVLGIGSKNKKAFIMDFSDLDFTFGNGPLSDHEKFMVKRWLSSNLRWEANGTDLSLIVSWPIVK